MMGAVDLAATICLGLAVLHTFLVSQFQRLALKFPEGSISENIFHLLGEVEVVFGFWAAIYLLLLAMTQNVNAAVHYLEAQNFTEPAFVFTIMTVCVLLLHITSPDEAPLWLTKIYNQGVRNVSGREQVGFWA